MKNSWNSLLIHVLIFSIPIVWAAPASAGKTAADADPSKHPVYSTYKFSNDTKVIDIAIPPVAIPAGVLSETIKRDRILLQALHKMGIELRFHPFQKGKDANFFMRRGDVEAAIFADIPALTLAATSDAKVVAVAKQGFSSIVTNGHKQINDLKGKRIGNAPGSTAHYALLRTLASTGLKESDVKLVPMDAGEMPGALASGKIDAFAAWEPTPAIALNNNQDAVVINRFISMSFLYFSKSFADRNHEAARQIVAALVRAITWLKQDQRNLLSATRWTMEANKALTGKEMPLSLEQAAALTTSDILSIPSSAVIPAADLQKQGYLFKAFEFFKANGLLPAETGWDKTRANFDNSILSEVLAKPARYGIKKFNYSR